MEVLEEDMEVQEETVSLKGCKGVSAELLLPKGKLAFKSFLIH